MDRRMFFKSVMNVGMGILALSFQLRPSRADESVEIFEITKSDDQWRSLLTSEQYNILRKEGTESPFKTLITTIKPMAFTCARDVICPCSHPMRSMTATQVGQVFGNLLIRRPFELKPIGD